MEGSDLRQQGKLAWRKENCAVGRLILPSWGGGTEGWRETPVKGVSGRQGGGSGPLRWEHKQRVRSYPRKPTGNSVALGDREWRREDTCPLLGSEVSKLVAVEENPLDGWGCELVQTGHTESKVTWENPSGKGRLQLVLRGSEWCFLILPRLKYKALLSIICSALPLVLLEQKWAEVLTASCLCYPNSQVFLPPVPSLTQHPLSLVSLLLFSWWP